MKMCGLLLLLCGLTSVAMAQPVPAPEIDPASATSAVAFLAGGFMILRSRLRR